MDFRDQKHLSYFLKSSKSSFIDYYDKIERLSKHISEDKKDPFSLIFSDGEFSTYLNKLKIIRNYIAHESTESRKKYIDNVLNKGVFITPGKFLSSINKKTSTTNYSIYIKQIENMFYILCNPEEFVEDKNIQPKTISKDKANIKVN